MGGGYSRSSKVDRESLYANGREDFYASTVAKFQQQKLQYSGEVETELPSLQGRESIEKQTQARKSFEKPSQAEEKMEPSQDSKETGEPLLLDEAGVTGYSSSEDEFYDGIPRYSDKSKSRRPKKKAGEKVSKCSRLGRARNLGLGKAVVALGHGMTSLSTSSGFVPGTTTKSNELSILSFEVANTIVKGSSLMLSLSKRSLRHLQELVLPSEGVQELVSKDMDELLRIVAADRREELKIFSGEVIRFGNRCKDSQWHNLDRYFVKRSRENMPHKQLKEDAESVMQQLMILVQHTAELYQELHTLDVLEEQYQLKCLEGEISNGTYKVDGLRAALKTLRKKIKNLQKKSLWSRSLEEVMEKIVDMVLVLTWEIRDAFGSADDDSQPKKSASDQLRLGPAGLALHYANIVLQIDSIVARYSSVPDTARYTLYQNLPPGIKSTFRSKLHSFSIQGELNVTEIKDEMEKILCWLVPLATNTARDYHGFGWVGEWASTRSEMNRRAAGLPDAVRIETFHYADKEKTEAYILELLLWLNHLVSRSKGNKNCGDPRPPIKSSIPSHPQKLNQGLAKKIGCAVEPNPGAEEHKEIMHIVGKKEPTQRNSGSQDLESIENDRLGKSGSYLPARGCSDEQLFEQQHSSEISVIGFGRDEEKALDLIDRVEQI